jgi:hypothetical protein
VYRLHKPQQGLPQGSLHVTTHRSGVCDLLSFLEAYSGFHQIPLYKLDQIKTLFITPYGAYCYVTMPFGLKNAGATYR